MTKNYTVRRGSNLAMYLLWAFPYRDYISEPRSKECLKSDVVTAIMGETSPIYRDSNFVMCRGTRFDQFFKISHIQLNDLFDIIESDLVPASICLHSSQSSDYDYLEDVFMPAEDEPTASDDSYYTDEGYDSM